MLVPGGTTGALTRTMAGDAVGDAVAGDPVAGDSAAAEGRSVKCVPRLSDAQRRPLDAHAASALTSSHTMRAHTKA